MSDSKLSRKDQFINDFAAKVIEQLEAGTAPWQKPWQPGEVAAPFNPTNGTVYKGHNSINLALSGYSDPRWMTFDQAKKKGYRVRKGEKATPIMFWSFEEKIPRKDANGKLVKDAQNKQVYDYKARPWPVIRTYKMFNASQIDGIEPYVVPEKHTWEAHERAEKVIASAAQDLGGLYHDQADRAFYSSRTDSVHMPDRSQFENDALYYSTILHEIGHSTGHVSRLDRPMGNPFGTEEYAREELRAEISAWMVAAEMGIGHDPSQHTAYVGSWIKALKENPAEIYAACGDAEQIKKYVCALEHGVEAARETLPQKAKEQAATTAAEGAEGAEGAEVQAAAAPESVVFKRPTYDVYADIDSRSGAYSVLYCEHGGSVRSPATGAHRQMRLAQNVPLAMLQQCQHDYGRMTPEGLKQRFEQAMGDLYEVNKDLIHGFHAPIQSAATRRWGDDLKNLTANELDAMAASEFHTHDKAEIANRMEYRAKLGDVPDADNPIKKAITDLESASNNAWGVMASLESLDQRLIAYPDLLHDELSNRLAEINDAATDLNNAWSTAEDVSNSQFLTDWKRGMAGEMPEYLAGTKLRVDRIRADIEKSLDPVRFRTAREKEIMAALDDPRVRNRHVPIEQFESGGKTATLATVGAAMVGAYRDGVMSGKELADGPLRGDERLAQIVIDRDFSKINGYFGPDNGSIQDALEQVSTHLEKVDPKAVDVYLAKGSIRMVDQGMEAPAGADKVMEGEGLGHLRDLNTNKVADWTGHFAVQPCEIVQEGGQAFIEECEPEKAQFWGLYAQESDGRIEHHADFKTEAEAEKAKRDLETVKGFIDGPEKTVEAQNEVEQEPSKEVETKAKKQRAMSA